MNYHDVLNYVRGITSETDVNELLDFSASVVGTDPLLSTLPILFFQYRDGDIVPLVREARRRRQAEGVEELLQTYRTCLQCEEANEFRSAFFTLALQVAEDLGDERMVSSLRASFRCGDQQPFEEEEGR